MLNFNLIKLAYIINLQLYLVVIRQLSLSYILFYINRPSSLSLFLKPTSFQIQFFQRTILTKLYLTLILELLRFFTSAFPYYISYFLIIYYFSPTSISLISVTLISSISYLSISYYTYLLYLLSLLLLLPFLPQYQLYIYSAKSLLLYQLGLVYNCLYIYSLLLSLIFYFLSLTSTLNYYYLSLLRALVLSSSAYASLLQLLIQILVAIYASY